MGDQRTLRELGALVKLGVAVVGCRDTESLYRLLVECVFGSIPAERAAILLRNDESEAFAPIYGRDRAGGVTRSIRVSQTIVDYVTLEGVAVLAKDVSVDELFGSDEDLAASGVHSVLAVPFVIREKKLGVLYLESGRGEIHFDDENLHFASAVVEIGAAAIEHVRFVEGLGGRS
jgi:GAF domain-containing protein